MEKFVDLCLCDADAEAVDASGEDATVAVLDQPALDGEICVVVADESVCS